MTYKYGDEVVIKVDYPAKNFRRGMSVFILKFYPLINFYLCCSVVDLTNRWAIAGKDLAPFTDYHS